MLIKMLTTKKVCDNGFTVQQLVEGEVYDIRDMTARSLISRDEAVKVDNADTYVVNKLDEAQQALNIVKSLVGECDAKYLGGIFEVTRLVYDIQEELATKATLDASVQELDDLTIYNFVENGGNA